MSLFFVSACTPKQDSPVWTSSVVAKDIEEGYRIGKAQFEIENPDLVTEDYTIVATGNTAEKSITT